MDADAGDERIIGPVGALSLCLGCVIGWGCFYMPGSTFLPQAGPVGTAIAFALSTLVMMVIAFNFSYMSDLYPQAGGPLVFADRVFGDTHSFVCSWCLVLSYLLLAPYNATALTLLSRTLLGHALQVGLHYTVAGFDVYLGETALALGALLLCAAICRLGKRAAMRAQAVFAITMTLCVGFVFVGVVGRQGLSLVRLQPAFGMQGNPVRGVLSIMSVSPWAFVGFEAIAQVNDELTFSPRLTRTIMALSIVLGAALYVGMNTVAASVVPDGYATWAEYLGSLTGEMGVSTIPAFNAARLAMGTPGLAAVTTAAACAILSGIVGFSSVATRLVAAMAANGAMPTHLVRRHPHRSTYASALRFVELVALALPFLGRTTLGWAVDVSSIGTAVAYGYTSAATYCEAKRLGNVPMRLCGALGTAFSVIFVALLVLPIPYLGTSIRMESYMCLATWIALGINFYTPKFGTERS